MNISKQTIRSIGSHSVFRFGLANLIPRTTAILTAIVVTPLGVAELGPVEYGYWVLATQVSTLVVAPDFGLGSGVINELGLVHRAEGGLRSQRGRLLGLVKLLRAAALIWFIIGVTVSVLYVKASGTRTGIAWDLLIALVVGLGCFTIGIPMTVWSRAQLAQEQAHRAVQWEGVGKILTLVACVVVLVFAPSLLLLVVAYCLPSTLALWINARLYVRREFAAAPPSAIPSFREAIAQNRHVMGIGRYFVLLQVCYLLSAALDPYLVNSMHSPGDVTYLSVTRRPYDMLPLVVSMFAVALWPVFARLHANAQWPRLRRLVIGIGLSGSLLVGLAGAGVLALRTPIYSFLGSGIVNPPSQDLAWISVQMAFFSGVLVLGLYLNAVSVIRSQAMIMIIATAVLLALKLLVLSFMDIHAFIAVSSAGYVFLIAVPIGLLTMRHLFRARE